MSRFLAVAPALLSLTALLLVTRPNPAQAQQTPHHRPLAQIPKSSTGATPAARPAQQATSATTRSAPRPPSARTGRVVSNPRMIKQLEQLIEYTEPDDAELPDLLFRLADMYAQSAEYWRHTANKAREHNQPADTQDRAARDAQRDALKTFERIATEKAFARYARMDEVLYFYAFELQSAGASKQALAVYQRLVVDHPKSRYIPNVLLAFAEHYFDNNDVANAERFYDRVLTYPKARVYTYALYKRGWVYLNLGRFEDALGAFRQVNASAGPRERTLARAARNDYVRAYAHVGTAQSAYQAFERLDKSDAMRLLNKLAQRYADQGKYGDSMTVYRSLIKRAPADPLVCEWQLGVADAAMFIGRRALMVTEMTSAAGRAGKLTQSACRQDVRTRIGELARALHSEGVGALGDVALGHADALYSAYTTHFADAPDLSETRYYHAELLWARASRTTSAQAAHSLWLRAAALFAEVADDASAARTHRDESRDAAIKARANAAALEHRD